MFRIGQEVVCISVGLEHAGILKGHVYTISAVDPMIDKNGTYGVLLKEVPPAPVTERYTGYYAADKFRPAIKTDISIFTAMLSPTPKERADA